MALAMSDREYIAASSTRFPVEGETYKSVCNHYESSVTSFAEERKSYWFGINVDNASALPFVANTARAASLAFVCAAMVTSPTSAMAQTRPHYWGIIDAVNAVSPAVTKLDVAMVRLEHLASKPAGWKGSDSVPLSDETKAAAQAFLRDYFTMPSLPSPFIGLDADGDLTLYWKGEGYVIDLSIMPSNKFSYYAEFNDMSYEQDNAEISVFPHEIISRLMRATA